MYYNVVVEVTIIRQSFYSSWLWLWRHGYHALFLLTTTTMMTSSEKGLTFRKKTQKGLERTTKVGSTYVQLKRKLNKKMTRKKSVLWRLAAHKRLQATNQNSTTLCAPNTIHQSSDMSQQNRHLCNYHKFHWFAQHRYKPYVSTRIHHT